MHISWIMLRKQGALNNQTLRLGCCFPPLSNFLAMFLVRRVYLAIVVKLSQNRAVQLVDYEC